MLNQRRPILPARLQTSTFGVRMLNYCVRHGNRWNHPAIVTRYSNIKDLYLENYTEEIACFETFQAIRIARSTSANRASLALAFLGRFRVSDSHTFARRIRSFKHGSLLKLKPSTY